MSMTRASPETKEPPLGRFVFTHAGLSASRLKSLVGSFVSYTRTASIDECPLGVNSKHKTARQHLKVGAGGFVKKLLVLYF